MFLQLLHCGKLLSGLDIIVLGSFGDFTDWQLNTEFKNLFSLSCNCILSFSPFLPCLVWLPDHILSPSNRVWQHVLKHHSFSNSIPFLLLREIGKRLWCNFFSMACQFVCFDIYLALIWFRKFYVHNVLKYIFFSLYGALPIVVLKLLAAFC